MKKYISPALQVNEVQVVSMMAVSLMDTPAEEDSEVLSKEDDIDWDIWEE